MKLNKKVIAVDVIILVVTLAGTLFLVFSQNNIFLFPQNEDMVLFEFENLYFESRIIIDDNPSFESPTEYLVEDGFEFEIPEGIYFMKIDGELYELGIRKLELKDNVKLKIIQEGNAYKLVNNGGESFDVEEKFGGVESRSFSFTPYVTKKFGGGDD